MGIKEGQVTPIERGAGGTLVKIEKQKKKRREKNCETVYISQNGAKSIYIYRENETKRKDFETRSKRLKAELIEKERESSGDRLLFLPANPISRLMNCIIGNPEYK